MQAVSYKKIEEYWMSKIDENDIHAQTLLYRYLIHLKNQRKLQTELNSKGVIDVVKNQHQQYTNPNKILKEIRDIEKELQRIEQLLEKLTRTSPTEIIEERKPLL